MFTENIAFENDSVCITQYNNILYEFQVCTQGYFLIITK